MEYLRLFVIYLMIFWLPVAQAAPKVVASIKPIHSLVAELMSGVGEPKLLVPDYASPHSFQLRPSDAQALHQADMIVWLGPEMETFLAQPIKNLPRKPVSIVLLDTPSLTRYPTRLHSEWSLDDHDKDHHHDHDHDHDHHHDHEDHHHGAFDAHIWLDPVNAQLMTASLRDWFISIDPDNTAIYEKNASKMHARLTKLDETLEKKLKPGKGKAYMVYHDAFQYFEKRYQLKSVGAFHIHPTVPPSVKQIHQFRDAVQARDVVCVFTEPQFSSPLLPMLLEDLPTHIGRLDPLGLDIPAGIGAYEKMMLKIADDLNYCLMMQSKQQV